MLTISGRNVNHVFENALWSMKVGMESKSTIDVEQTRNGEVYSFTEPVCLEYRHPEERVLFSSLRDANPFFHFMESLWMLAGRNDVEFVSRFNSSIAQYSDDGATFHGAYGHRWRNTFNHDQILWVINHLTRLPNSRRAVITMWSPDLDIWQAGGDGLDVPCNLMITFRIVLDKLDMTVMNRSNDLIWGACGANAVHMSYLHEFVACFLRVSLGVYRQISANMHVYTSTPHALELIECPPCDNRYEDLLSTPPMIMETEVAAMDCEMAMSKIGQFCNTLRGSGLWITDCVALPMYKAWDAHKGGDDELALVYCNSIASPDWSSACSGWIKHRMLAKRG